MRCKASQITWAWLAGLTPGKSSLNGFKRGAKEMDEPVIATRPLESGEKLLKEKFAEALTQQSEQMDRLGL